ncbi:MAG TPA: cobaltochelatase subunit CobN [Pyrinomonadaceae bacterium]|nr:cobaltochelatase subunit CobN [Pyrinomonadaceae bacterium]
MKVTVLYVGSSLLAPLKKAEQGINREYDLDLVISAFNLGAPLDDDQWTEIERELASSEVLFAIHLMNGENASRLIQYLDAKSLSTTVIVINCMPDLMRRMKMGRLNARRLFGSAAGGSDQNPALKLIASAGGWMGRQARKRKAANEKTNGHDQYLKFADRLPAMLKFIPNAGALRDVRNYLNIFSYFLQPTPANIQAMILSALKEYAGGQRLQRVQLSGAERVPSVAIYHPDASQLFEAFDDYQSWYLKRGSKSKVQSPNSAVHLLDPQSTIGLLLMRPQVISKTTKHYDGLIRALEDEGLSVIPALSTLMDNRQAVDAFFIEPEDKDQRSKTKDHVVHGRLTTDRLRVSQIISLTGFSFVGGPAMNDSEAASRFLQELSVAYRSAVSVDMQSVDSWRASETGLNPVQAGMQIAIPEIDGATEPFIYGGLPEGGVEPLPLDDRCRRFARRITRWNRLQTASRDQLKLALVLFCFPPNKGNIGTAADLDVFPSLHDTLSRLASDGYQVEIPSSPDGLRDLVIGGNAARYNATANVAYRMTVDEYKQLCPYVAEIEKEWGSAPGKINAFADELLIQGIQLGNVFIGVQPTFGFEGDPMRLMMARGSAPHHGFMAFYTYLGKVLNVDAVVHVGTHGAMEFMPGKQVGLSGECWPDRLVGELPNIYLYSVNNPSEGSIAKRRSYAELISYLTPPLENAGVYRELSMLKDLLMAYRQATDEREKSGLYVSIDELSRNLNFAVSSASSRDHRAYRV